MKRFLKKAFDRLLTSSEYLHGHLIRLGREDEKLEDELACYKQRLQKLESDYNKRLEELESRVPDYDVVTNLMDTSPVSVPHHSFVSKMEGFPEQEQLYFTDRQLINGSDAPYIPTYSVEGDWINDNHSKYNQDGRLLTSTKLEGWLRPADALKIYEMSYFSPGDILQLGTYKGLSTSIVLEAILDSGDEKKCDTVDLDPQLSAQAKANINEMFGSRGEAVEFHVADGTQFIDLKIIEKKKYGFIFIDHWHGYRAVYTSALRVNKLLIPGGFVLFHDYASARNFFRPSAEEAYGVLQGANDALMGDARFEFCGTFGCTGMFRFSG